MPDKIYLSHVSVSPLFSCILPFLTAGSQRHAGRQLSQASQPRGGRAPPHTSLRGPIQRETDCKQASFDLVFFFSLPHQSDSIANLSHCRPGPEYRNSCRHSLSKPRDYHQQPLPTTLSQWLTSSTSQFTRGRIASLSQPLTHDELGIPNITQLASLNRFRALLIHHHHHPRRHHD